MKTENINLPKLHTVLCLMLEQLDKYFSHYQIDYSLTGGNLIGAIRHHGFIPWDDDLDIIMTRDNFEKFKSSWRVQGIDGFTIEFECGEASRLNHTKIFKDGTIFSSGEKKDKKSHNGIWIDLFVLDKAPLNVKQRKKLIRLAKKRILLTRNKLYKKGSFFEMLVSMITKLIPYIIRKKMISKYNMTIMKYNQTESDFQYIELSAPGLLSHFYDRSLVDGGYRYCDYDGYNFKIFSNYDVFLNERFGDYNKLPPPDERKCKHLPEFIDFGD